MDTFIELYFLGESKNLCLVQVALEQISLFDLLDFGLLFQRRSGNDTFCHHVEQQLKRMMTSLSFQLEKENEILIESS